MNSMFFVSGIASAVVMLFSPQAKPLPAHVISPLAQANRPTPTATVEQNPQPTKTDMVKATIIEARATPTPSASPTPPPPTPKTSPTAPTSQNFNSDADALFALANEHRKSLNLPLFQKDDRVCSLANARAPEIAGEMANGTLHSGMYGRNLPYWNTENAIAYGNVQTDFNWWLSDYIHKKALEEDFTYSCTACSGIYCVEEFTSFQPK
ncbi:MAG TPA: hypothetical protein VLF68_04625 [Candidatus Saccharimonadales bacterium]|nr:hypothetical protein [Candidatus Saccharimonadales bacterium]